MKLPRSSFKILRMIILGYLHQGGTGAKPSSLQSVARATGLNATVVSGNNAALSDLGIIERVKGGAYALTREGAELARALEFEEPELIKRSLAPMLVGQEPIAAAVSTVRIRGGLTEEALANQLALAAGEPRTPPVLTGARAVIEMLTAAGVITQEGDRYAAAPPDGEARPIAVDAEQLTTGLPAQAGGDVLVEKLVRGQSNVRLEIAVTISGDDLQDDERAKRILAHIADLKRLVVDEDAP